MLVSFGNNETECLYYAISMHKQSVNDMSLVSEQRKVEYQFCNSELN